MLTVLLILIPLLAGVITFGLKGAGPKILALLSSIATLGVALVALFQFRANPAATHVSAQWIPQLKANFEVGLDGMAAMLCLLTALAFVLVFVSIFSREYERASSFYGLMLLSQAGLTGVFVAADAMLFYVFWELALIPVYFLCSMWGGERRIPVTFKFFVYTFIGSLFMLVGIIYLYLHAGSFGYQDFIKGAAGLSASDQNWLFWLFFAAFAIKMPIFPLHTWQPDTYEQSPTPVTMILSGVMVKMGLFGVLRWLLPVLPHAAAGWADLVMILSIIGIVYASCIAIVQSDLKRMIAYSSIAHIGLMSAAIFAHNETSLQGVMVQMFNHGINIIGLWIIVDVIEQRLGVRNMKELGGIASKAPKIAIFLVVIALANVALPLTNGFIGEFLMFSGVFQVNVWFMAVAGLGIILSAVYVLNMIQRVIFGESNSVTSKVTDLTAGETFSLTLIVLLIVYLGVYPKPLLELVQGSSQAVLAAFGH